MDEAEVVKNLRSCLISCKGGIKLDNLKADYRMIAGEHLPFRQLGYSTLEDFVRTIPDVNITSKCGVLYAEAAPSRSTAHLAKLISRQKTTKRKVPQTKKWMPPRYVPRSVLPKMSGFRSNNFNGFQSTRGNHTNPPGGSFTRSTPGKSNLYTDFSRPIMPLMATAVQHPDNKAKPNLTPAAQPVSPTKRLTNKATSPSIATKNQNGNNCKTVDIKCKVLNDQTAAAAPVITAKPKTVELRPSKLSERLKIPPPENIPVPQTPSPPIDDYNNGNSGSVISAPVQPSLFNISKIAPSFQAVPSDPRKELEAYTNMLSLPLPVYKISSNKDKHSAKLIIYARVKIGSHTFCSFPEHTASTEQEAEKIAARLALINLPKELSGSGVTTVDVALVKERILNIVTKHQGGVFMHVLPEYYNKEHDEILPNNWQRVIEECADINQEKACGDLMILRRVSPKRSDGRDASLVTDNYSPSGEKIQLSPIGPAVPDKLTLPETDIWHVCPTYVMGTMEVWARLGDYNDNFVDMMEDMKKHYNEMKEPASSTGCIVGNYYTITEYDYWHRVQCLDLESETGLATVLFIDEGHLEQYTSNLLHPLNKKFCALPAQATRLALHGLEDFHDYVPAVTEVENELIADRMFYVEVHNTGTDEYGPYTTVTFYDTRKEDEDIDVNQIIADKILNSIIAESKIQVGIAIELYVTHIDHLGQVYAQLNTFARNLLNSKTMSQISPNNMTSSLVKTINFTKMYLVNWNSQLYRARVKDIPSEDEVTVFLVDVGKTITTTKNNLFHIDTLSKALQSIPPQATQIFLQNINPSMYNERLVTRFRELVSDTDLLFARVIKINASGTPVLEIFKRELPYNRLVSINHSVTLGSQLPKVNEDNNNNIKSKKRVWQRRNCRALSALSPVGKLNPPTISDIGQYFDIHVTLAAHPGHFIVQPLHDACELKVMMQDLQKCYDTYEGPSLESVGEGMLYAGQFNNDWYRVYVTNIISDNEVSVYFCDFGDVTIVQRSSLLPLKSEFLKLPYQAVKAKLVGIEPTNTDWSVGDCVRFKDLVLDKNFVSIVIESMLDNFSPANGTVIGLRLIDVSTEKDVYIDKLLVEEKRAKFIDGFEESFSSS